VLEQVPQQLTDLLAKYDKVALISFGTSWIKDIKDYEEIAKVVKQNPQIGFIWSYGDKTILKADNLIIEKRIPLKELMKHPKVKLIFHHCGMGTTLEEIYYSKVSIGIPTAID
jgi:UDP:flavonoid glycosyltransferase YjiC (YdhE family)